MGRNEQPSCSPSLVRHRHHSQALFSNLAARPRATQARVGHRLDLSRNNHNGYHVKEEAAVDLMLLYNHAARDSKITPPVISNSAFDVSKAASGARPHPHPALGVDAWPSARAVGVDAWLSWMHGASMRAILSGCRKATCLCERLLCPNNRVARQVHHHR
jgi:hypothetical protein